MRIEQADDDVLVWIKAVPGASRDEIAGCVGNRLKVRIAAAPEAGKANKAIIRLFARTLTLRKAAITIEAGHTAAEKIIRFGGARADDISRRIESVSA